MNTYQPNPPGIPVGVSINESGVVAYGITRDANGSDVFLGLSDKFNGRLAGTGMLFVTLATVSYQALKAALMNPVKSLRSE